MRSLFFKIFLSYWLAQALFMTLVMLVTLAMRPPSQFANLESQQSRLLNESVQAYQNGGVEGLRSYSRAANESLHVRLFLFNEQGRDVTGHQPHEWIVKVEQGKTRTADSIFGRLGALQFLRASMTADDGHRYTLVIELPLQEHAIFGPNGEPAFAIGIGIISSGLICFFLARYLTAPIAQLRAATQRLAAGDLTARAGSPDSRRRDEMSQLLRDFDRMAGRLEDLVESQDRLLKDISHELRSPLARLHVALALTRQRTGPEAESSLDRMELEANRLNELIGRLLTIARLEGSHEALQRAEVSLGEIVAEVAKDAAYEAQSRHCHVDCVIAAECSVSGDAGLLHSAIENVVRNAIRYTPEGTTVRVQLECGPGTKGQEAVVDVTDCGPGVPEEALEKLFQPFYRIDDARGRGTGGVGLGLAITERAVRLHGGSVRAANRAEGGLLVEIRLPLASDGDVRQTLEPAVMLADA